MALICRLSWVLLILLMQSVLWTCNASSAVFFLSCGKILFWLRRIFPWKFIITVGLTFIAMQTLQSSMFLRSCSLVVNIVRFSLHHAGIVLWHCSDSLGIDLVHGYGLRTFRTELLKIQGKLPLTILKVLFVLWAELSYQNLAQVCLSSQFLTVLLKQIEAASRVFKGALPWFAFLVCPYVRFHLNVLLGLCHHDGVIRPLRYNWPVLALLLKVYSCLILRNFDSRVCALG